MVVEETFKFYFSLTYGLFLFRTKHYKAYAV